MTKPSSSDSSLPAEINTSSQVERIQQLSFDQLVEKTDFPVYQKTSTGKIKVPSIVENFDFLIRAYGIVCRYNECKKRVELSIPRLDSSHDEFYDSAIHQIISIAVLNELSTQHVVGYLNRIALDNSYHPVRDWIDDNEWDGKSRIGDLVQTIVCEDGFDTHLFNILVSKWLTSSVAALYAPDFSARGVLTLVGGQGIGKSSWVRKLAPPDLSRDNILPGCIIDPSSKDSVYIAISHWIVEIAELEVSYRKEFGRLKAFLTSTTDRFRKAYAVGNSELKRTTVFIATVNDRNFMQDKTGNSRWWTIPVKSLDYEHNIDVQQVYAEIKHNLLTKGSTWWLSSEQEQMLNDANRSYEAVSSIEEQLQTYFDFHYEGRKTTRVTATQMLQRMGYERPTNPQAKEAAIALRKLFGDSKRYQGSNKWNIPIHPDDNRYGQNHDEEF